MSVLHFGEIVLFALLWTGLATFLAALFRWLWRRDRGDIADPYGLGL